jgi:Holliday junction resolvasome RuvABC endonuclease subunit
MRVLGIDPGLINVGWAIVENGKLVTCGVFNMTHKVPVKERKQYARLVKRFMRYKMFRTCDVVVIERQMSGKLRVVANSFLCFNWGKSYLVSPRAVRNHHGISMSNYKANKRASVARVPRYMTGRQVARFREAKKRDDMADAILIALYWYETCGVQNVLDEDDSESEFEMDENDVLIEEDREGTLTTQPTMKDSKASSVLIHLQ